MGFGWYREGNNAASKRFRLAKSPAKAKEKKAGAYVGIEAEQG